MGENTENSDWDLVEGVVFRALTYSDDIVDDHPVPFADLSMRDRAMAALRSERSISVAVNRATARDVASSVDALLSERLPPSVYLEQSPSIQQLASVIASGPTDSAPSDEVDVRLQNSGRETDAACAADYHQHCACPATCACVCHLDARPKTSRSVAPAQLLRAFEVCVWKYDPDGYWQTQCGDQFLFSEGGPTENRVKFCHFCGRSMFESIYANEQDDHAGESESE